MSEGITPNVNGVVTEDGYIVLKLLPYEYSMLLDELKHNLRIINRDNANAERLLVQLGKQGGINLILPPRYKPPAPLPEQKPEPKKGWRKFW